jgi:peptide subunit release factor 1 (eRF1)
MHLRITEIRVLTENLAELAEQSSTEVKIVSVKTKEGQMLKNSFKGVAAILRSKPQESPQSMS